MSKYKNPYLSRVRIKNFRNFLNTDVRLGHKQVIIGENNVGKTNFLRAIQLILDKSYSDSDRELLPEDFHESLEFPMENGVEIEIVLEIQGYEHNRKLVAQFDDAVISDTPPTLQITYKYFPNKDEEGNILDYRFSIYKGNNENAVFRAEDRNFINIYVIKALRDVERELNANKNSPLYKLVKQYEISSDQLQQISDDLKQAADGILKLDEIIHIKEALSNQFAILSGLQKDNQVTLRTFDIDTERLLYTLQVYIGLKERPVSELSLGLANLLYISLMLLLLKDKTIIPVINEEVFESLLEKDKNRILSDLYQKTEKGNYVLKEGLEGEFVNSLYRFMDENNYKHQSFTILAVEEPEAHLHPVLQRLIYREILHNSNTSVIFTSHSTHIASVAPLESIVHIRHINHSSNIFSTVHIKIDEKEKKDIERYIDAKRGEIYFGKAIILVEGITEEYLIPSAATLLGNPLDDYGIVVCNIDSTNFRPYIQVLDTLNIPWILFTDGDYYEKRITQDSSGETGEKRIYHVLSNGNQGGYRGNEIIGKLLVNLNLLKPNQIPEDYSEQDEIFQEKGCFIGIYTLEVDMMNMANSDKILIIKDVYDKLKPGGKEMQENFENALDKGRYWSALKKIENNIGKGRFSQRLASEITVEMFPSYIVDGIKTIVNKVKEIYE